ncbi:MAG TPA: hypothetical protein VNW29_08225 [Candidatus Sulfotelmatobacter sp.]|jgi:hypothetical protein|nr:hypothetical protein [Candidatus Sulfotelmatobacter sp.]
MHHYFSNNQKLQQIILFFAILLPFIFTIAHLLLNDLSFWYDPARDLLLAWGNITKPTLIGPPSGIPGIFYGPYWIWLLSIGLLFSKNPVFVTFITATIPYIILFPLLWFRFTNFFDKTSVLLGWILFMFGNGIIYATQLWNPYPAPLLTMTIIYLLITIEFTKISHRQLFLTAVAGFLIGLLINFHISFGIAFSCGVAIFYLSHLLLTLLRSAKDKRLPIFFNELIYAVYLGMGCLITFLPTIFFESRHGFHQTQALLHTFYMYGGGIVGVQGMNKIAILQAFFITYAKLLHISLFIAIILLASTLILLVINKCKNIIIFREKDEKIILLISSLFAGVLLIYLTAKNPVWEYHFIGVDVLFIILLTFFSAKLPIIRKGLLLLALYSICIYSITFVQSMSNNQSQLIQQKQVVTTISNDAKKNKYTVYAYSPSIYIYEYSYLFRWLIRKDIPYDPGAAQKKAQTIYLIIPKVRDTKVNDFISYRSPSSKYRTVRIWQIGVLTIIKTVVH